MYFDRLNRYAATLRPLRPVQVCNRLVRRLRWLRPDLSPAPSVREASGPFRAIIRRNVSLADPTTTVLLNQVGGFASAEAWNDPSRSKLWLYNLHYFDWLAGPRSPENDTWNRASISRWIAENPVGRGNGWEPYPLSLRIGNWIKWLLAGEPPVENMIHSLAVQLRYLSRTVEWHLLGNHLLANAKAIFLGGCFFGDREGDAWLTLGDKLLAGQWEEQIMPDGGHEERSPMYQAILLEDVLDCVNAVRRSGLVDRQVLVNGPAVAGRMLKWLSTMTHPDGQLVCFNDTSPGIAPQTAGLGDYAARLGIKEQLSAEKLQLLEPTGYARAEAGCGTLFVDLAPVGPDHQPGHAHADTLGFELSLKRRRILVSAGTSTYEPGRQRAWERSTRAHNCLVLEDLNSSDVWATFRTGRRARIISREAEVTSRGERIAGSHDGWQFLSGKPLHHREWIIEANRLAVSDGLVPPYPGKAIVWLHFAPGIEAEVFGHEAMLSVEEKELRLKASAPLSMSLTSRALGFNRCTDGISLSYPLLNGSGHFELVW